MPLRFRTIVCTVVVAAIGVACQPPMTHIEVQVIPYPGANLARLPCEEFVLLKTEDPVPVIRVSA